MVTMQLDVLHRTRIIVLICLIRQIIHKPLSGCCSMEMFIVYYLQAMLRVLESVRRCVHTERQRQC